MARLLGYFKIAQISHVSYFSEYEFKLIFIKKYRANQNLLIILRIHAISLNIAIQNVNKAFVYITNCSSLLSGIFANPRLFEER